MEEDFSFCDSLAFCSIGRNNIGEIPVYCGKAQCGPEFANALKLKGRRGDGYIESENSIVTWCVGHLVTMSYPEAYDIKYKRWSLETLPFLPKEFKYQVIDGVSKQFKIVSSLLNRADVETILRLYRLRTGGRVYLPSG